MVIPMVLSMVSTMVFDMGHIPYKNSIKCPIYRHDLKSEI